MPQAFCQEVSYHNEKLTKYTLVIKSRRCLPSVPGVEYVDCILRRRVLLM